MEQQKQRYPIGIQTFSELIKSGYVYIDKTEQIYGLTHSEAKYVFLSRPRRFGKSLLTSTLHSYFAGQKELFKGLAIEKLEKEWTEYPVLHFDMSTAKHMDREELVLELEGKLDEYERVYGREDSLVKINQRLEGLIKSAYRQTGKKVVVLIDEYDAPLLDVVHKSGEPEELRHIMRNFYSPLKACDPYLRFMFMTGITKFSQLSIFSELNNINNVSMDEEYADICGITEEEMATQMRPGICSLAQKLSLTEEETLDKLKEQYDGYHFTWPSPDIYNPFSLLNALSKRRLDPYWFGSGTPTYLIEMLKKFHVRPSEIGEQKVFADAFDAPTEHMTDIVPLLYQSGYITIKGFQYPGLYSLDIPNKEVRIGLMRNLLPNYITSVDIRRSQPVLFDMHTFINEGDMDSALRLLQTFLSTIPYCDNTDYEGHYQQLLYIIFSLLGYFVDVEVRTPVGRVDMVLRTANTLYLLELKLNKSADTAMRQIDLKQYSERFALCSLPVVKVAVNFDRERHTLGNWKIE